MKITILGCGSFHIDKEHSAPASLIQFDGKNILVDCGPGTLNQMAKIGFDPHGLDYIFITHVHADHSSDLFPLLMRTYLGQKFYGISLDKPLTIVGPKGIEDFVRKLCDAYELQFIVGFSEYIYKDFESEMSFDGFGVNVFPVTHLGVDANALRFKVEDKKIVFSGDSAVCDGVKEAARDADLFIVDCSTPKGYPTAAHLGTIEVGEICKASGVKKVILSHQVPPGYSVDMVSEVKEAWEGDVALAHDLMELDL
jgi:ribonuclease BN (tRNA processing enzyme)